MTVTDYVLENVRAGSTLTFSNPEDAYEYWEGIQKLVNPYFMGEVDFRELRVCLRSSGIL